LRGSFPTAASNTRSPSNQPEVDLHARYRSSRTDRADNHVIDLVCIDVDGTLVGSSGIVSDAVWRAADDARARGVRLVLCSGRPAFGVTRTYAEQLDASGWHVFQNGASVINLGSGETRSRAIPPALVAMLIERSRALHRPLELYTDTMYAVELDTPRTRAHADLLGVPFERRDLQSLRDPVVRAQWLVSHVEAEQVLAEPHDGLTLSQSLSPVMPDASFVNITPKGVDKAFAVRLVAEAYGVPLERVMMVGDSANDISTMRIVGIPVAMGNAEPGVRDVATSRVATVDEDGLVEALALTSVEETP
jgi:Cof subfamily protein (haloacid dehalogenase superfamily)